VQEKSGRTKTDMVYSGSRSNDTFGESSSNKGESHELHAAHQNYRGTSENGKVHYDFIDTRSHDKVESKQHTGSFSKNAITESDTSNTWSQLVSRHGNTEVGTGSLVTYSKSSMVWKHYDRIGDERTSGGNPNPTPMGTQQNLSWPVVETLIAGPGTWGSITTWVGDHYTMTAGLVHGIWSPELRDEAGRLGHEYYGGTWVYENAIPLLRTVGGLFDVTFGVLMSGTGVGAAFGVPLVVLGMDQIFTAITDWRTGTRGQSAVEYLGYSAAQGMGYSEETSHVVGGLLPAGLSLGLGLGGYAVTRWVSAGRGGWNSATLGSGTPTTGIESIRFNPAAGRFYLLGEGIKPWGTLRAGVVI